METEPIKSGGNFFFFLKPSAFYLTVFLNQLHLRSFTFPIVFKSYSKFIFLSCFPLPLLPQKLLMLYILLTSLVRTLSLFSTSLLESVSSLLVHPSSSSHLLISILFFFHFCSVVFLSILCLIKFYKDLKAFWEPREPRRRRFIAHLLCTRPIALDQPSR